jgi:hypothetical protein
VKIPCSRRYSLIEANSPQQIQSLLSTESLDCVCTNSSRRSCHPADENVQCPVHAQAQARRVHNISFVLKSRCLENFANVQIRTPRFPDTSLPGYLRLPRPSPLPRFAEHQGPPLPLPLLSFSFLRPLVAVVSCSAQLRCQHHRGNRGPYLHPSGEVGKPAVVLQEDIATGPERY